LSGFDTRGRALGMSFGKNMCEACVVVMEHQGASKSQSQICTLHDHPARYTLTCFQHETLQWQMFDHFNILLCFERTAVDADIHSHSHLCPSSARHCSHRKSAHTHSSASSLVPVNECTTPPGQSALFHPMSPSILIRSRCDSLVLEWRNDGKE
jgi:hypothetical protein